MDANTEMTLDKDFKIIIHVTFKSSSPALTSQFREHTTACISSSFITCNLVTSHSS